MSKRLLVTTLAFLILALPLLAQEKAAAPAATGKAPRLTVIEPVKDFGTVPKGEKLSWTFKVKNTGDADLEIIAARPACGCTVAEFDKKIKPGETGSVTANVDTAGFAGPISKPVTLETNDPTNPTAQITIHAIVKPYVEAHPAGFVRYNLLQGDSETQSVTLYSEEETPFEIVKIEAPQDWIVVKQSKITDPAQLAPGVGRPGQAQYKIDFTVGGPKMKLGPIAEKVRIVTNSKNQPEYMVSVTGVVRPTYRVEPTAVNFGEVAPTDLAATRTIKIRTNNLKAPDAFVVNKVESSIPGVAATVKPTDNKGEYEVTLQVAKDAKPADIDGKLKISTTDKLNPTVEIPLKGTIKASTPSK
ncbi:MAG TPA: DUF1573 domain-containing protein [Thermoanaerobaculia bacterium]|jgi:hypothetical protein